MERKYRERLEQVIRVLEELPTGKKFSLRRWMTCGTIGCAVGWAAMDPWFRRRGLRLEIHAPCPKDRFGRSQYWPSYRGHHDFEAVSRFFGLDYLTSRELFDPRCYQDGRKRNVIARIKKFLAEAE